MSDSSSTTKYKKKEKKDKKEKKKEKKEKKKEKKKKKQHKKDKRKEKKSKRDSKQKTSNSTAAAEVTTFTSACSTQITNDDYFRRGPNFRLWLTQFKQLDFEDLETIQAREHFTNFVQLWNTGQLSTNITAPSSSALRSNPRTKFAWGIQTSTQEKYDLDTLHDSITRDTNKRKADSMAPSGPPRKKTATSNKNSLLLAKAKAAEAAEDAKMAQFRRDMGLE
jgi:hypothetical protein